MKSSQSDLLPVTLVKNYIWCKTYAWLSWNGPKPILPQHSRPPEKRMSPIEVDTLLEALGHRGHIVIEAELEDVILGLRGRVDYLAEPDPPPGAVVEYKHRGRWGSGDIEIVQTALYTIMAENIYRRTFKGYLVLMTDIIEVDDTHKAKALSILSEVKASVFNAYIPEPGHDLTRCKSCIYRRICPYSGS